MCYVDAALNYSVSLPRPRGQAGASQAPKLVRLPLHRYVSTSPVGRTVHVSVQGRSESELPRVLSQTHFCLYTAHLRLQPRKGEKQPVGWEAQGSCWSSPACLCATVRPIISRSSSSSFSAAISQMVTNYVFFVLIRLCCWWWGSGNTSVGISL